MTATIAKKNPARLVVDIETKPTPELVRKYNKDFPAFVAPPPFDPSTVKVGNIKDPVKQQEKIEASRMAYAEEAIQAELKWIADEKAYWAKLTDEAALRPYTSEIIAINLIDEDGNITRLLSQKELGGRYDETQMLTDFWSIFRALAGPPHHTKFLYWSGSGGSSDFDPSRIVTRSRIRRVEIPAFVRKGRYWGDAWVDLAAEWLLHQRQEFCSLTLAGQVLGVYDDPDRNAKPNAPTDTVTGKNCWEFLAGVGKGQERTPVQQRELAFEYMCNDLYIANAIADIIL